MYGPNRIGIGGLGACYTWERECYPVPDPGGQQLTTPAPCPGVALWFWIGAIAIAVGGAVLGGGALGGNK